MTVPLCPLVWGNLKPYEGAGLPPPLNQLSENRRDGTRSTSIFTWSWGGEGTCWPLALPLPCSLSWSCRGPSLPGATKPDTAGRWPSPAPVAVTSVSTCGDCSSPCRWLRPSGTACFLSSLSPRCPALCPTQQHREGQLLQGLAGQ